MCKKLNNKHALLQSLHLSSPAFALVTIFCLEGCLFGKSFRCHTKRSLILYTLTFENQRAKLWTRYLIKLSFSFFLHYISLQGRFQFYDSESENCVWILSFSGENINLISLTFLN